jgi:hypothetical protein
VLRSRLSAALKHPEKQETSLSRAFSKSAGSASQWRARMRRAASFLPHGTFGRTGVAALTLGVLALTGTAPQAEPRAVIELFTSQGCSSCPPADKLLAEYAARDDVLALSFNVDIWDWTGWKDTLAQPDFTERQRAYAGQRGGQVYTPQAVINGATDVIGSDREAIEAALAEAKLSVPVTLLAASDSLQVRIPDGEASGTKATLWLVMYDRAVSVPIENGENDGKTVTYSNVVRKLRPIAMWKGKAMVVDLPLSEIEQANVTRCAVLLQAEGEEGAPGTIIGAATIRTNTLAKAGIVTPH